MKVAAWLSVVVLMIAIGVSLAWRFLPEDRPISQEVKSIRIEVSNGCGMPKAGRAIADELQLRGFDVYSVTGQDSIFAATTVVDLRDPGCANARKVADALGFQPRWWRIPLGSVVSPATSAGLDSSRYLEARLVVGKDFRRFFPKVAVLR
jgi:hypothetical protein